MDSQTKNGLAVIAANYLKRILEKPYDQIFETEFGKKLQQIDDKAKYLIEFTLNALTAYLDQKIAQNSPLKRFIQEVGLDAAPEISARMLKGFKSDLQKTASSPKEKDLAHILLQLKDKEFQDILTWLYTKSPDERKAAIRQVTGLSLEELMTYIKLSGEDRNKILEMCFPRSRRPQVLTNIASEMEKATNRLKTWSARIRAAKNS